MDDGLIYERLLPAVPSSVPRVRRELGAALEGFGFDARRRSDIALFVTEAVANAVRHAYSGERGAVYAAAAMDERWLNVAVSDWGRGAGAPAARDAGGAGLGLSMMRGLASGVRVDSDGSGTDVEGSFALDGAVGAPGPPSDAGDARARMLREYVDLLQDAHEELRQDTAALMAQARHALAHSRARRQARQRLL